MDARQRIVGWGQLMVTIMTLNAIMMFGVVSHVYADDDRAECQHRIQMAEAKLDVAIRKHGEHSAKTDARRAELKAQRERCYNRVRAWWNGHEHKWHEDRDWTAMIVTERSRRVLGLGFARLPPTQTRCLNRRNTRLQAGARTIRVTPE